MTLTPDPVTGKASAIATLTTARAVAELKFVCPDGIAFTGTGSTPDCSVRRRNCGDYKPRLHDLALLLRLTGARIEPYRGTDGSGLDEDQAKEIGTDYFANGVIVNRRLATALPGSLGPINGNAVFDAARRFSRRCTRLIRGRIWWATRSDRMASRCCTFAGSGTPRVTRMYSMESARAERPGVG